MGILKIDEIEWTTAPVSGRLTCHGKPVKGVLIALTPITQGSTKAGGDKPPATGVTDGEGRFVLTTYEKGDGAVAGKHKVAVIPKNPGVKLACPPPTDKTFTVTEEGGELLIEL